MQTAEFRQLNMQVVRKLNAGLQLAEQHFNRTFPVPTVNYRLRGVKAGVAYPEHNEIRLNRTLLLENPHAFIAQVVWHELAHLIVYQVFGRVKPHGAQWRAVMTDIFHLPAQTSHRFNVQNVQGKTFAYQCACQTHYLTLRRHNKVQKESAVYFCRKCGRQLSLVNTKN
ncbi:MULTISPECIES: SprT family zinc-dependent metalloprotease [Pasteurellaceae]|uniref:SprT family zinc-dependent metalloprotease n=1 Tax=Pasteurellaceae TaxID=712 RepID=UPI00356882A1